MEKQIRDRFTSAILEETMRRFGIAKDQIHPLDAFESFIYEFERGGQFYILRIAHSLRRTEALIAGEVDWINYLADGGISVARAVHSASGRLVEAVEDGQGGQFLTTAFVKAQGQSPWRVGWTPTLYENYGRLLGSIHARTRSYQPAELAWTRPGWDADLFEFVERYLPASEAVAKRKYHALCDHLHRLPKDNNSYGLIHQDAHGSNLFVDEAGALTLFDFDECAYSWFINDIAIALFYMAMGLDNTPALAREFMTHFLQGYRQALPLDPWWLREIPNFLKLREIELYAVIHRDFDVTHIDDPWCADFMRGRKERIEQDVPTIDFDFRSLAALLAG